LTLTFAEGGCQLHPGSGLRRWAQTTALTAAVPSSHVSRTRSNRR